MAKWAINYRNMHNGIHGLLLFNNKRDANKGKSIFEKQCKIAIGTYQMNEEAGDALEEICTHWLDEIDWHDIHDDQIEIDGDTYNILNWWCSYDLYF